MLKTNQVFQFWTHICVLKLTFWYRSTDGSQVGSMVCSTSVSSTAFQKKIPLCFLVMAGTLSYSTDVPLIVSQLCTACLWRRTVKSFSLLWFWAEQLISSSVTVNLGSRIVALSNCRSSSSHNSSEMNDVCLDSEGSARELPQTLFVVSSHILEVFNDNVCHLRQVLPLKKNISRECAWSDMQAWVEREQTLFLFQLSD